MLSNFIKGINCFIFVKFVSTHGPKNIQKRI